MPNLAAGYNAIFVSVDLPVLGTRPNETRNKFAFPPTVEFPNLRSPSREGSVDVTAEGLLDYGSFRLYACYHITRRLLSCQK